MDVGIETNLEEVLQILEEELKKMDPAERQALEEEIGNERAHVLITAVELQLREQRGWGDIHELIETAPYCHHKEQIIITRFCPKCKRHPRDNVCNLCITEEDMASYDENEMDCETHTNAYGIYFRKKLCYACCQKKKQFETSAAA